MKLISNFLLTISAVISLLSCSDDDNDDHITSHPIYTVLTRYNVFENEDDLLDFKISGGIKTYVINSKDEMEELLGSRFIEKYKDYVDVDFTDRSAIICLSKLVSDTDIHNITYYTNNSFYPRQHVIEIDYKKAEILKTDYFIIEVVGIVVDKLRDNTPVFVADN